ncbi:hypothetical protein QFC20_000554 [Naganishia adeliensis]|uniref:Uncharacterized protein n=1 Tax=Naganishia adeliensis TaxID=92952 RepID=A0ACC2X0P0_9TREE|nr:hypothetical protein QFC20_000554 [Naganishia adeliensis]
MVVAEFTSAQDTQPTVVAGTAPTAEHTTTTTTKTTTTSDVSEAATANGNTNGMPDISIVQRVGNIPIVADGIGTFESVVNSTQFTSSMYATAGAIAAKSLDVASPIIATAAPLISKADGLANQGLDMVEARFPSAFKVNTHDILESAKQPANQGMAVAKGVYDGQIAPILHNEIVSRAIEQLYNINKILADGVNSLKDRVFATTHNASEQAHDLSAKLVDQLHVLQSMSTAYSDVRQIMGDEQKTTQQKATDIAHYVQPELDKAQALLFKKKASHNLHVMRLLICILIPKLQEDVKSVTEDVQAQAQETAQDAQKAAQETINDVQASAQ